MKFIKISTCFALVYYFLSLGIAGYLADKSNMDLQAYLTSCSTAIQFLYVGMPGIGAVMSALATITGAFDILVDVLIAICMLSD